MKQTTNATSRVPKQLEEKVKRIENGVLPQPALRSRRPEKCKLVDRMDHYKVPGVSIAVIHNSNVEWARGYGVKQTGTRKPVTADTLFQAGSISKPVAAIAALRLVQSGELDLDEDVNKYLLSWKVPSNGAWQPNVTIRQLLSHSAGLTVHGFLGYPRDHRKPTLLQVLSGKRPANSSAIEVNAIPGTQYRYSGGGYCVLQQLLIDVTGKSFPKLMQELVLHPLGMENSTYEQPLPEERASSAATGHRAGGKKVEGKWHVYPELAAAGLWTTPSDLARFAVELQLSKAGRSNKILSTDMTKQLLTPQIEDQMGLGLRLQGTGETARFSHGGWDEGFVSEMVAYHDGGLAAVVMSNSDVGGMELNQEILRGIAEEYSWPGYLPEMPTPTHMDLNLCEAAVGKYELRPGFQFAVTSDRSILWLQPTGQRAMQLYAESDTEYFLKEVNASVSFVRKEGSEVTGLTFKQNEKDMPAKKVA